VLRSATGRSAGVGTSRYVAKWMAAASGPGALEGPNEGEGHEWTDKVDGAEQAGYCRETRWRGKGGSEPLLVGFIIAGS